MQALKIKPHELFLFADIDSMNTDKLKLIEMFRPLLVEREINEIRFLLKVVQEFVDTFEKGDRKPI